LPGGMVDMEPSCEAGHRRGQWTGRGYRDLDTCCIAKEES
jgi:hypothetical protein